MTTEEENLDLEQQQKLIGASVISSKQMKVTLDSSKTTFSKQCSSVLLRRIYILNWITTYDFGTFVSDLIAGVTLGLTIIPQSIAYAALAGLSSEYGLYSAFVGAFTYVIFGSVKQVSIGPTSLMALLLLPLTAGKPIEYVFLLALIAGTIELLMGLLNLGFIVEFIPIPVTTAFTSATSLVIIASQLKNVTGLKYLAETFTTYIYGFLKNIQDIKLGDTVLGLTCCVTLLLLRKLQDFPVSDENPHKATIKKILWYITISRNAIVVAVTSVIAYFWSNKGAIKPPFELSGHVTPGIPEFKIPSFSIDHGDGVITSFYEILSEFGIGIIFVPLVAILANVSIAKAFSSGKVVDASQEMIALGLSNILGSFAQAMPTCGAFSRSAVSEASGVKTPMAGIYSGTMTLLALSFLTPYFYFIPKAALGSVLICAVYFLIDQKLPLKLWKENRKDFISWLSCFIICITFGVEIGLLFGIVSNIFLLTYQWMRPTIDTTLVTISEAQYIKVTPSLGLLFLGIDYLREFVNKISSQYAWVTFIVVDCSKVVSLDYTSIKGIQNIGLDAKTRSQKVVLLSLPTKFSSEINSISEVTLCSDLSELEIIVRNNQVPVNRENVSQVEIQLNKLIK